MKSQSLKRRRYAEFHKIYDELLQDPEVTAELDQISATEQWLHQSVEYLRIGAEHFLAACVWLELKLVAAGIDPILVVPVSMLIFVALRIRNRMRIHFRRRLLSLSKWILASPVFLFAGYVLVDEILYWSPYAYTERLSQITGIQREYPVAGGSETAVANFSYPNAVRTINARRHTYAVIDADTLRVGKVKVRLNGIAAPESGHPLYDDGKRFVRQLLRQGRALTCHLTGEQTYDREVGYCFISIDGQKIDIQAEVVSAGLARDCRRYSGRRYRRVETAEARELPLPGYCGLL